MEWNFMWDFIAIGIINVGIEYKIRWSIPSLNQRGKTFQIIKMRSKVGGIIS